MLAQAAILMLTVQDNPPTADTPHDAVITNYLIVNCRDRLRAPYNAQHAYPGYCLGFSPLTAPLSFVSQNDCKDGADIIVLVANFLRERYSTLRQMPSLLAVTAQHLELNPIVQLMKDGPP